MSKTLIGMEADRLLHLMGGKVESRTDLEAELDELEWERDEIEDRISDVEHRLNRLSAGEALPPVVAEQVLTCVTLHKQYGYELPDYLADLAKCLPEEAPA